MLALTSGPDGVKVHASISMSRLHQFSRGYMLPTRQNKQVVRLSLDILTESSEAGLP